MENEGQEPAEPQGQTPEPTPEPTESKTFDAEYVKNLRAENASYRTKLKTFEREEETRKTAAMSDLEKSQKTATDAEARAQATEQRLAKRDALDALRAANIVDPDLAYLAIRDEITLENGEATNIADLVSDFVKARPAMVKNADVRAPETKSTNVSTETRAPANRAGRL